MGYDPEFVTTNGRERGPDDCCIVSCGIGPDYQEALHSTRLHCEVNVPEAWRLFYRDYPGGCPNHADMQYAFKIYAMQRAIAAGFRYVLWIDSSFQPIRSIAPLWQAIKAEGWYVPRQGSSVLGTWASDQFCDLTAPRDVLMKIPLCYSGLVGLDMNSVIGKAIWEKWLAMYKQGAFNGAHLNVPGCARQAWGLKFAGHCSDDPRCEGHRHDESALSWILHIWSLVPDSKDFLTLDNPHDGLVGNHVRLQIPRMKEGLIAA